MDSGNCVNGVIEWLTACDRDHPSREFWCYWSSCGQWSAVHYCDCSQGGGGGCFLAGTLVTLADGRSEPIEAVRSGGHLLAYDESSGNLEPAEVIAVHVPRQVDYYYIINGGIRVSATQPVLSRGAWVDVEHLKVGDLLTAEDNSAVPIFSIRKVEEKVTVYNLASSSGTYIADGIIVHNKPEPYEIYPGL